MRVSLSPPFSRGVAEQLHAGDEVTLSANINLVLLDVAAVDGQLGNGLADEGVDDGGVYCFAAPSDAASGDPDWNIAAIDEPAVDQAACALLAAGARAFVAWGRCPATVSYALRKYRGLYFAVSRDWLRQLAVVVPVAGASPQPSRPLIATFPVDHVTLTLAHDAHGRSVATPGSPLSS